MKRIIFGLLILCAGIALTGCAKTTDPASASPSTPVTGVSTADAKVVYAVVQRILGYCDPKTRTDAGIACTTVTAASNDQTDTSLDSTYKVRLTTPKTNFSDYPQDRTYTITLAGFKDTASGYTLNGTITFTANFSLDSATKIMTVTNMTQVFSLTLGGGSISKASTASLTRLSTSAPIIGTVLCDSTSFNAADIQ
jgi:hypothetical protein